LPRTGWSRASSASLPSGRRAIRRHPPTGLRGADGGTASRQRGRDARRGIGRCRRLRLDDVRVCARLRPTSRSPRRAPRRYWDCATSGSSASRWSGAPWFDSELNELGAAYFRSQGFDIVSSASAELSRDPRRIEPAPVYAWTARHVGEETEGVFIGGNWFRAAQVIEQLEAAIGRPVLASNQVLLWSLLVQAGCAVEITGYGRLFAPRPERSSIRNA
jgi:hypothetical protein